MKHSLITVLTTKIFSLCQKVCTNFMFALSDQSVSFLIARRPCKYYHNWKHGKKISKMWCLKHLPERWTCFSLLATDPCLCWNPGWRWGGWGERSGWRRCGGRTPCVVRVQSHRQPVRDAAGTAAGSPPHSGDSLNTGKRIHRYRRLNGEKLINKNWECNKSRKQTCKQGMSPSEKLNVPMMSSPSL